MSRGTGSDRRRVFVVLLGDDSLMLFPTWEAAEQCADKRQLPLDHIHEFETDLHHPEHLHLLFAASGGAWDFHGKWPTREPEWKIQPDRIRLEHFHVQGPGFRLFRRKVFPWRPGLLARIDPMAPEAVLNEFVQPMAPSKTPGPSDAAEGSQTEKRPLRLKRDRPPSDAPPSSRRSSSPENAIRPPVTPRLPIRPEPEPVAEPAPSQKAAPPPETPVPSPAVEETVRPPKSIPAEAEPEPESTPESSPESTPEPHPEKVRRIWPMRLIAVTACTVLFWIAGLVYPFLPVRTTEEIIAPVAPLRQATRVAIEPGFIYFERPVDPIHQQRWVQTLELDPIPFGRSLSVPAYEVLISWERPEVLIPPPFSGESVAEWWNPRQRRVAHGFYHQWEDGSLLILDLQRNALVGWGQARHFAAYMR
jgi:hypothetical protein